MGKQRNRSRRKSSLRAASNKSITNNATKEPAVAENVDTEHAALIDSLLSEPEGPNVEQLRIIAATRGLATNALRARAWPVLAGLSPQEQHSFELTSYQAWAAATHRDSAVVKVDVDRSLHAFTKHMSDEQRQAKRAALKRILDATVNSHDEGCVYYYQGLHDIASVLLLVMGERPAFTLLRHLTVTHLRDATRAGLDAVIEVLGLMYPILAGLDEQLAGWLRRMALQPFFALAWLITWWAHDMHALQDAARLFDLFISGHPMMPLYVGAVAMHANRSALMVLDEMPEVHSALVNIRPLQLMSLDELASRALDLYQRSPPELVVLRRWGPIATAVTPAAALTGRVWELPEHPPSDWSAPGPGPECTFPLGEDEDLDDVHGGGRGASVRQRRRKGGSSASMGGGGGGPFGAIGRFVLGKRGATVGGDGLQRSGSMDSTRSSSSTAAGEGRGDQRKGKGGGGGRRAFASAAISLGGIFGVYMLATIMTYAIRSDLGGGRWGRMGGAGTGAF